MVEQSSCNPEELTSNPGDTPEISFSEKQVNFNQIIKMQHGSTGIRSCMTIGQTHLCLLPCQVSQETIGSTHNLENLAQLRDKNQHISTALFLFIVFLLFPS